MDLLANIKSVTPPPFPDSSAAVIKLYDSDTYTAFGEDLEFMWRWTIYRDQKLVQEGCSLTLEASRRAVEHVMAFFTIATTKSGQGAVR